MRYLELLLGKLKLLDGLEDAGYHFAVVLGDRRSKLRFGQKVAVVGGRKQNGKLGVAGGVHYNEALFKLLFPLFKLLGALLDGGVALLDLRLVEIDLLLGSGDLLLEGGLLLFVGGVFLLQIGNLCLDGVGLRLSGVQLLLILRDGFCVGGGHEGIADTKDRKHKHRAQNHA